MPIVDSSYFTEPYVQANGRRRVKETHIDQTGKKHQVEYLAKNDTDLNTVLSDRIPGINQSLIDAEISNYLSRISQGLKVIGENYQETTQQFRSLQFLLWAKRGIQNKAFSQLRYAWKVTENYTINQINTLLVGTEFANKADKIKAWESKLKSMDAAMDEAEISAGEV